MCKAFPWGGRGASKGRIASGENFGHLRYVDTHIYSRIIQYITIIMPEKLDLKTPQNIYSKSQQLIKKFNSQMLFSHSTSNPWFS